MPAPAVDFARQHDDDEGLASDARVIQFGLAPDTREDHIGGQVCLISHGMTRMMHAIAKGIVTAAGSFRYLEITREMQ